MQTLSVYSINSVYSVAVLFGDLLSHIGMSWRKRQKYWLGLHLLRDIGIVKLTRLLAHFENAEALWLEADADVMRLDLPKRLLRQFCDSRRKVDLERELDKVARAGATLITVEDDDYPELLRALSDHPPLLYARGRWIEDDEKRLAVVGTRKASQTGWDAAYELSRELAGNGVSIVSGLAQGIDAAAHRGALDGGGRTIAVVGTGVDRVYPADNRDLAERIVERGAIISELPLGSPPLGKHFPQRNRIISGLSLGVLVAEAPFHSGAKNTVSHALEQGRDVFAVPHNIFNQAGAGCNELIQEGAKLVMGAKDVLDELELSHSHTQTRFQAERILPENPDEIAVFALLGADPLHVDLIVRGTALPTSTVASALTLLELKGLAESAGPMQYCRARSFQETNPNG